ncbi:MAG: hypothetical protein KGO94_03825 [Alphaproteobacteria bacterium]|nr:hypothetical protein [Alphaproteobacteria bacterium]
MGWLKNLFGGGAVGESAVTKTVEYKGFVIEAQPYKEGGQFQLAGIITKDGKTQRFVRADKFSDKDEAAEYAIQKGQLMIDQMGEGLFKS